MYRKPLINSLIKSLFSHLTSLIQVFLRNCNISIFTKIWVYWKKLTLSIFRSITFQICNINLFNCSSCYCLMFFMILGKIYTLLEMLSVCYFNTPPTKKKSFLLKISSVNVTKSSVSCDLVTFTEDILNGKLHFLWSVSPRTHSKKCSKFTET